LNILKIDFGSPEQIASVKLRYAVLREPLGLTYDEGVLATENEDFHIAAFSENELVGILLLKPFHEQGMLKMRQVAVNPLWQRKGVGRNLVNFSEEFARKKGFKKIELHARENAIPFYTSLHYIVEGDMFLEVGIPHKKMYKVL